MITYAQEFQVGPDIIASSIPKTAAYYPSTAFRRLGWKEKRVHSALQYKLCSAQESSPLIEEASCQRAIRPYRSLVQSLLLWPEPHPPHRVSLIVSVQSSCKPPHSQLPG